MEKEYFIKDEYSNLYQSIVYEDGREEQIRLPEPEEVLFDLQGDFHSRERKTEHVQAFVNNISAPKSLDEMLFLIEYHGCFIVEEVLNNTSTEWTVPGWAKHQDIVFFMHSKTANSSLTAIRTELNRRKNEFSEEVYNLCMNWINRGLHLHKLYGGKIFAIGQVYGSVFVDDQPQNPLYHWGSRLYAEIKKVTILENPIDISEFRDFLMISRVSGVTPVFGGIYYKLKELIAKKNEEPYFMKYVDATPIPLAKINAENWMTLSNEYRRAFMLESQFRHYYVDYLLRAIADRKKLFKECLCQKTGMANSFVDNVIFIKGKYLAVEVKLSVDAQKNIKAQVQKYCYDDNVILEKNKNAGPKQFHPGKCLIIDTDNIYMFDYDTDVVTRISGLDSIASFQKVQKMKAKIEGFLSA